MIELLFYSVEILFFAIVVILLARFRTIISLIPLYMFLAASLLYGELIASFSSYTFLGINITFSSIIMYPLILYSIILVSEIGGIKEAKKLFYGIILTLLIHILIIDLHLLNSKYFLSQVSHYDFEWQMSVFHPHTIHDFFSIFGLLVAVFLLIVVYNYLSRINSHIFICVFISLSLALYSESLISAIGLYISGNVPQDFLYDQFISKTFSSILFSVFYVIGFPLVVKKEVEEEIMAPKIIELDESTTEFGGRAEGYLKILIVEDSPESMELLTFSLKYEDNWEVVSAKNGKEALGMVFAENPDIILLDIMMPEMDGYEVVKILKAHKSTRDIPIILITAKVEKEDKLRGMAIGIDDYITKPYVPEEVIARIRMVLKRDRQ